MLCSIEDELAITNFLTKYAHAYDTRDWDLLVTLFDQHALLDYTAAGGIKGNIGEIVTYMRVVFGSKDSIGFFSFSQHLISNIDVFCVDQRTAKVRAMFFNPLGLRFIPIQLYVGGWYNHNLTKYDNIWKSTFVSEDIVYNTVMRDLILFSLLAAFTIYYLFNVFIRSVSSKSKTD